MLPLYLHPFRSDQVAGTARVVTSANPITPTGGVADGTQAAVILTSSANGVYQDIGATYEAGFRYAFTTLVASSIVVSGTDLLSLQFRDRNNNVLAARNVTA